MQGKDIVDKIVLFCFLHLLHLELLRTLNIFESCFLRLLHLELLQTLNIFESSPLFLPSPLLLTHVLLTRSTDKASAVSAEAFPELKSWINLYKDSSM